MKLRILDDIVEAVGAVHRLSRVIGRHDSDLAKQMRRAVTSVGLNAGEGLYASGANRTLRLESAMNSGREVILALRIAGGPAIWKPRSSLARSRRSIASSPPCTSSLVDRGEKSPPQSEQGRWFRLPAARSASCARRRPESRARPERRAHGSDRPVAHRRLTHAGRSEEITPWRELDSYLSAPRSNVAQSSGRDDAPSGRADGIATIVAQSSAGLG